MDLFKFEYDLEGSNPAVAKIDPQHYLVVYRGPKNKGWSIVLGVDNNWNISTSSDAFIFDSGGGDYPAIAKIKDYYYLVVYSDPYSSQGRAVVLKINPSDWSIEKPGAISDFDSNKGIGPAISKIDDDHYLVVYRGPSNKGWSVVLEVKSDWSINKAGSYYNFDSNQVWWPDIAKIDPSHYLVVYERSTEGWSVVLEVKSDWSINKAGSYCNFDSSAMSPAIAQFDSSRYLIAYAKSDWSGWLQILRVKSNYSIEQPSSPFEFDSSGIYSAIAQVDSSHYLLAYQGADAHGWSQVLRVESDYSISTSSSLYNFDPTTTVHPSISKIDNDHYLVVYRGQGLTGWAAILEVKQ